MITNDPNRDLELYSQQLLLRAWKIATTQPSGSSSISNNILDPALFNFEIPNFENGKPTLRLKDIWIPRSPET